MKILVKKGRWSLVISVGIVAMSVLGPYGWMFITSLKSPSELTSLPIRYWPSNPTFDNYRLLFKEGSFGYYFTNSLVVAVATTAATIVLSLPAAYAFSRFRFKGQKPLLLWMLMTYLIPAIVLVVPLFVVMLKAGLLNTFTALVLAHLTFTLPFGVWMLTGYFNTLPKSLDEAALVDGASRIQTLSRILVPIMLPSIVATGLFSFIVSWNDFVFAVMIASDETVRTLPVELQLFLSPERSMSWGILSAAGVLTSLPVAVVFLFFQKYLIGGLTAGSVK